MGSTTHTQLSGIWIFKGGTCIKKCFIETFRFSEDLDFTVLEKDPSKVNGLKEIFDKILDIVHHESGIVFTAQDTVFRERPDGNSVEGRIYYHGPLERSSPSRIKLDLTTNERVVRPSVLRDISHPHEDSFPSKGQVRCYAFEELFAEKIRALAERYRPRDLYDVINLYRRPDLQVAPQLIYSVLQEKCRFKDIPVPTLELLQNSPFREELVSEWANMLAHQLPTLPPLESFLEELEPLFKWLTGEREIKRPERMSALGVANLDWEWRPPATNWRWGIGIPLEAIRYAAANQLCVDLGYQGTTRRIEPYSLRKTKDGNLLLYSLRVSNRETRAYRVDRIEKIEVTTQPFTPSFLVEFTSSGIVAAKPLSDKRISRAGSLDSRSQGRSIRPHYGPTYVFQCPYCQKEFKHKKNDRKLRRHKGVYGSIQCPGRQGYLVRIDS